MTIGRAIMMMAGFFIMLTLAGAHFSGQINFTTSYWLWFTAFVGANLFQSSFTGFCPAAMIFKALGLKSGGAF